MALFFRDNAVILTLSFLIAEITSCPDPTLRVTSRNAYVRFTSLRPNARRIESGAGFRLSCLCSSPQSARRWVGPDGKGVTTAKASPDAAVYQKRPGSELGSVLWLQRAINCSHAGVYTCELDGGDFQYLMAPLDEDCSPVRAEIKGAFSQPVAMGSIVTLTCLAVNPSPDPTPLTYFWTVNGEGSGLGRINRVEFALERNSVVTCTVANLFGNSSTSVSYIVALGGSALRPLSYRCSQPISGSNDPACTVMGDVFNCTTNGGVVPYLSDGVRTTQYLWQGSSFLDLDIPNSVCLEAIVITFNKPSGDINLPGFTLEQTTNFTTIYPSSPDGVDNTAITFTQQYCQPTIRINMAQAVQSHFIILQEVFLIQQPADSSTPPPDPPTTMPLTNPASPSSTTTSQVTTPGSGSDVSSTPADLTLPVVAGVVAAAVVVVLLVVVMVMVCVLCVLLKRLRSSSHSDTKESAVYDHVDQDHYTKVTMETNPAYEVVEKDVIVMEENPAYEAGYRS